MISHHMPAQANDTESESLQVSHEPKDSDKQPQPWTAPDFVERSVLAEIGAYSFAAR